MGLTLNLGLLGAFERYGDEALLRFVQQELDAAPHPTTTRSGPGLEFGMFRFNNFSV